MNVNVYGNKEMTIPIIIGKRGVVGWQWKDGDDSENGTKEEMIFLEESGTWITMKEYRERKAERIRRNREFYRLHPRLLVEKRRVKQGRIRFLSCAHPYHS